MNITVKQWMDKLAIVEKLEKAGDAAQISKNLSDRERTSQMRICREQLTRAREEMDRMVDRMTAEDRAVAGEWYDRHLVEARPGLYLG
jgi:anion-transporting  ArsA/GET3 family ATPase|tara:strand:+ start:54 stop:317 length:264 start_codon:yes stop_codon:yes gene_type:complete